MVAEARDPKTPLPRKLRLIAAVSFANNYPGCQLDDFQQTLLHAARDLERSR